MNTVTALSTTVAFAMAAVFLWAGLDKARDLASTASTIRSLGVPSRGARTAAAFVTLSEIGVALGLVFRPDSGWTQAGVVALAGTFAIAGMLALWRGEQIRCSCFGSGRNGYLGATQVVALLPWLGGVALLRVGIQETWSLSVGTIWLAVVGLTIATVRAFTVWKAQHEARGDRRSAQEMFVWLR